MQCSKLIDTSLLYTTSLYWQLIGTHEELIRTRAVIPFHQFSHDIEILEVATAGFRIKGGTSDLLLA